MSLWRILVLGVLKSGLNIDYDRLTDSANNHKAIRKMLCHGVFDVSDNYKYSTIRDNVGLLSEEILDKINELVVKSGHKLLKKKSKV